MCGSYVTKNPEPFTGLLTRGLSGDKVGPPGLSPAGGPWGGGEDAPSPWVGGSRQKQKKLVSKGADRELSLQSLKGGRYSRAGTAWPVLQGRYSRTCTAGPMQQGRYSCRCHRACPSGHVQQDRHTRVGTVGQVKQGRYSMLGWAPRYNRARTTGTF